MKTKGRPQSTNIEDRRFEKARPRGKAPYSTLKAKRERAIAERERLGKPSARRVKVEYTLDPMKRNELVKNSIAKSRGKKINIKTKVKP